MAVVCGLDLHRRQITFDALGVGSGEGWRGRIWQPDRGRFRRWLREDMTRRAEGGPVALAVEGCTGWRYVVEEIAAAGSRRTWPSRRTPRRPVVADTGPSPIAATLACCATSSSPGSCPRAGSHLRA